MNNKLKCRPVLLPTTHFDRSDQVLWLNDNKQLLHTHSQTLTKAQHLYLVSDSEIKEGDCYIQNDNKVWEEYGEGDDISNSYKIEASTDTSLGLPGIPQSFIEEYVAKQGKIDKVYIVNPQVAITMNSEVIIWTDILEEAESRQEVWNRKKDEEVIILPTVEEKITINLSEWTVNHKKTYTREEVIDMIAEFSFYFSGEHHRTEAPGYVEGCVKAWFDLNYPNESKS
jgi:hypothetical protein